MQRSNFGASVYRLDTERIAEHCPAQPEVWFLSLLSLYAVDEQASGFVQRLLSQLAAQVYVRRFL